MITQILPDGSVVDITSADSYAGPDNYFSSLNVNTSGLFIRLRDLQWVGIKNTNCLHRAKEWIEMCDDLDDVLDVFSIRTYDK